MLVFLIFMPSLAFTKLLVVVNPSAVSDWWPLWLGMVWKYATNSLTTRSQPPCSLGFGALLGVVVARLLHLTRSTTVLVTTACGFGALPTLTHADNP